MLPEGIPCVITEKEPPYFRTNHDPGRPYMFIQTK